jgi:putative transposase
VLAEQTDEWTEQRRYMGIELLAKARLTVIDGDETHNAEPTPAAIAA